MGGCVGAWVAGSFLAPRTYYSSFFCAHYLLRWQRSIMLIMPMLNKRTLGSSNSPSSLFALKVFWMKRNQGVLTVPVQAPGLQRTYIHASRHPYRNAALLWLFGCFYSSNNMYIVFHVCSTANSMSAALRMEESLYYKKKCYIKFLFKERHCYSYGYFLSKSK